MLNWAQILTLQKSLELLKLLEEKDKTAADAVCNSVFTSFNQVDYDPNHFKAARERLLKALS